MPSSPLLDLITQLLAQRQPRPDLITPGSTGEGLNMPKPMTFAGRVVTQPDTPENILKRLPTEPPEGEGMQGLGSGISAALMAKQFKPGANTIEELVARMVKNKEILSSRERLIPAIKTPAGEVFQGALGGPHPSEVVVNTLNKRGQVAGNLTYGFQRPGEPVFLPEQISNLMQKPDKLKTLNDLLVKGISVDTIISVLKEKGALP